jgi:LPS O-antigen subunit length determinant protein (WzzB/FepE family)
MPVIDMEDMLESAVDIQLTAYRVKAEAVRAVWDSLDEKARTDVLTGFVMDIQSQQDQVNRLLESYKSSKWVLLKRKTQTDRVEELLEYVGRRQRELTAFLETIQEGRNGGSIER